MKNPHCTISNPILILDYQDEIPFVNAAPIDEAETKKQKKQLGQQKK